MKTMPPKKLSLEDFEAQLATLIGEQFIRDEGELFCRTCRSKATTVPCCVSVHTVLFENCAGGGEVLPIKRIPWCMACEGPVPDRALSTCIHDELI